MQITHLNLATNIVQVIEALDGEEGDRGVSWLPFFHDMGLITALVSPMIGHYFTFMTPAAFVRRPGRWIREMARKPDDTGGVISVAPNFAFDHAAARGLPKDGEPPLDLSNVKAVLNGSEPISAATVRRFNEAFAPYGFKPEGDQAVLRAGRGDAVRLDHPDRRAAEDRLRRPRRAEHPPLRRGARGRADAPSRRPRPARSASPSGPPSSTPRPPPNCPTARSARSGSAARTWAPATGASPRRPSTTFQNILKSRTSPSHAEGATDDATWVRTGDYGAFYDGDLYITGRVKDLVIIDGRNHYPQDLEYSAQEASKALRTGFVAAFSVPANQLPDEVFDNAHAGLKRDPDDTSEQLVIVAERAPGAHKMDLAPVADDIRAAIAVRHGVTVRDVLLTPAGAIPRTSSGKIGRRACRAGLPRRQPAQRQDRQRLPRRDGLTRLSPADDRGRHDAAKVTSEHD